MNVVIYGPPGAGKGTQAQFVTSSLGIPQISTGDILRSEVKEASDLGMKVKRIMDSGGLVSDDLIVSIVKGRLEKDDCKNEQASHWIFLLLHISSKDDQHYFPH